LVGRRPTPRATGQQVAMLEKAASRGSIAVGAWVKGQETNVKIRIKARVGRRSQPTHNLCSPRGKCIFIIWIFN